MMNPSRAKLSQRFRFLKGLLVFFRNSHPVIIKLWHGICNSTIELIILEVFLGLNMIVSIPRESRAEFFFADLRNQQTLDREIKRERYRS